MVEPLRHRQTKEAETDMFSLQPPRHIPTLPRRQPLSVGSELSSLFEALVAATRLWLDLETLPSRLQVRNLARNRYAAAAAECLMLRDERTCRQSCLRTAFDPIQTSFWENGPSQTL